MILGNITAVSDAIFREATKSHIPSSQSSTSESKTLVNIEVPNDLVISLFLVETHMTEGQCSLQRPQWDELRNSVQGQSTSKKPHHSVLVTWTPGMHWLFLNLQESAPFPHIYQSFGIFFTETPLLEEVSQTHTGHVDLMARERFTTFPWKFGKKGGGFTARCPSSPSLPVCWMKHWNPMTFPST